jgi:hypothetical protein
MQFFYADSEYDIDFVLNSSYNDAQSQIRTLLSQGVSFVILPDIRRLGFFFRLTHQKMQNYTCFQNISFLFYQLIFKTNVCWKNE